MVRWLGAAVLLTALLGMVVPVLAGEPEYVAEAEREKAKEHPEQVQAREKEGEGFGEKVAEIEGRLKKAKKEGEQRNERAEKIEQLHRKLAEIEDKLAVAEREAPDSDETHRLRKQADELRRAIKEMSAPPRKEEGEQKLHSMEKEFRQLIEKIREIERRNPDSGDLPYLREKAHEMEVRLNEMREKMRRDEMAERERHLHEMEREFEQLCRKIEMIEERNPDSPDLKELRRRADEMERDIHAVREELESMRRPVEPEREKPEMMMGELAIFELEHVPAEYAAEIVQKFRSPMGVIVPDMRTNQIIIREHPAVLGQMEEILHRIDKPERRRPPEPVSRASRVRERVEAARSEVRRDQPRDRGGESAEAEASAERRVVVNRGKVTVENGKKADFALFRDMDRPIAVLIQPSVGEEGQVELAVEYGFAKGDKRATANLKTELGKPVSIVSDDFGGIIEMKFEVNRGEGDRLLVSYEATRRFR